MIVNSGYRPCYVCGKAIHANSVKCTVCKKWIPKRCSDVSGEFLLLVDGFRCKRCDSTIQEADLVEDLVVDGEMYGCVKSFSYLVYPLDADGGPDLGETARIICEWMRFQELLPFVTSSAPRLDIKIEYMPVVSEQHGFVLRHTQDRGTVLRHNQVEV